MLRQNRSGHLLMIRLTCSEQVCDHRMNIYTSERGTAKKAYEKKNVQYQLCITLNVFSSVVF